MRDGFAFRLLYKSAGIALDSAVKGINSFTNPVIAVISTAESLLNLTGSIINLCVEIEVTRQLRDKKYRNEQLNAWAVTEFKKAADIELVEREKLEKDGYEKEIIINTSTAAELIAKARMEFNILSEKCRTENFDRLNSIKSKVKEQNQAEQTVLEMISLNDDIIDITGVLLTAMKKNKQSMIKNKTKIRELEELLTSLQRNNTKARKSLVG